MKDIEIRPFSQADNLEELTNLLHRAYKKQADKGFVFLASHQSVDVTKKRLEEGEGFVGLINGKLVATITYYRHHNPNRHEWYGKPDVATYGQFAVRPDFQNIGIGTKLIELMEQLAKRDKVTELTIDTSEGAIDLINYYKKRGYREVGYAKWPVVNYRSLLLSKKIN